ncbi:hypothetical protein [Asticcacaulis sp. AND118]|uniref:hypothetical protein n=1 Tax=Asticcacaulis sp. AND118 TaxID=2840468 RepID=UPI001CFF9317|nr:hypothetical protein [Asticcacaulis sp. AND118]UDF03038.1 hypothetical protein LH365_11440 [Asticcacaulis sp. AND118]
MIDRQVSDAQTGLTYHKKHMWVALSRRKFIQERDIFPQAGIRILTFKNRYIKNFGYSLTLHGHPEWSDQFSIFILLMPSGLTKGPRLISPLGSVGMRWVAASVPEGWPQTNFSEAV